MGSEGTDAFARVGSTREGGSVGCRDVRHDDGIEQCYDAESAQLMIRESGWPQGVIASRAIAGHWGALGESLGVFAAGYVDIRNSTQVEGYEIRAPRSARRRYYGATSFEVQYRVHPPRLDSRLPHCVRLGLDLRGLEVSAVVVPADSPIISGPGHRRVAGDAEEIGRRWGEATREAFLAFNRNADDEWKYNVPIGPEFLGSTLLRKSSVEPRSESCVPVLWFGLRDDFGYPQPAGLFVYQNERRIHPPDAVVAGAGERQETGGLWQPPDDPAIRAEFARLTEGRERHWTIGFGVGCDIYFLTDDRGVVIDGAGEPVMVTPERTDAEIVEPVPLMYYNLRVRARFRLSAFAIDPNGRYCYTSPFDVHVVYRTNSSRAGAQEPEFQPPSRYSIGRDSKKGGAERSGRTGVLGGLELRRPPPDGKWFAAADDSLPPCPVRSPIVAGASSLGPLCQPDDMAGVLSWPPRQDAEGRRESLELDGEPSDMERIRARWALGRKMTKLLAELESIEAGVREVPTPDELSRALSAKTDLVIQCRRETLEAAGPEIRKLSDRVLSEAAYHFTSRWGVAIQNPRSGFIELDRRLTELLHWELERREISRQDAYELNTRARDRAQNAELWSFQEHIASYGIAMNALDRVRQGILEAQDCAKAITWSTERRQLLDELTLIRPLLDDEKLQQYSRRVEAPQTRRGLNIVFWSAVHDLCHTELRLRALGAGLEAIRVDEAHRAAVLKVWNTAADALLTLTTWGFSVLLQSALDVKIFRCSEMPPGAENHTKLASGYFNRAIGWRFGFCANDRGRWREFSGSEGAPGEWKDPDSALRKCAELVDELESDVERFRSSVAATDRWADRLLWLSSVTAWLAVAATIVRSGWRILRPRPKGTRVGGQAPGKRSGGAGTRADPLPPFDGKKTLGRFHGPDGKPVDLKSGWSGPAESVPRGTSGFDIVTRTHVEGHAAAIMRQQGLREGTVFINNPKICVSCEKLLPKMLPSGSKLRVMLPDGSARVFVGK